MARQTVKSCDICRRRTDVIVAKVLYIPVAPNGGRQRAHSNYSHHADVGACCGTKILKLFNFQERTTFAEYQERRRVNS
jgi:hypothetical protein